MPRLLINHLADGLEYGKVRLDGYQLHFNERPCLPSLAGLVENSSKGSGMRIFSFTFLALWPLASQASQLQDWLTAVVRNNPSLASSQLSAEAAREGATSRKAWDPPQVGVELFQTPVAGFPNPFYQQQEIDWSVQQMIPFPGKRAAMSRPENLRSSMMLAEKRARQNRLVRQFTQTYWELWGIEERLRLDAQRIQILSEIGDIAQRQLESGMASQTEVLRARSELTSLRVDSANLSRNRGSMHSMLLSLMARPEDRGLDSVESPRLPASPVEQDLMTTIDSSRPDVAGMRISSQMSQAMADAANFEKLPDFMIRGMYKQMLGMDRDYWSLMVGMTVPVAPWAVSGTNATVRQRKVEARRDQMEAMAMRNMAVYEARTAANELAGALASVNAADSVLIPQADLAWRSAYSSYRNGNGDFLMVLDSYRMSLMVREERIMAVMKAMQSNASLDEALGRNALISEERAQGGQR